MSSLPHSTALLVRRTWPLSFLEFIFSLGDHDAPGNSELTHFNHLIVSHSLNTFTRLNVKPVTLHPWIAGDHKSSSASPSMASASASTRQLCAPLIHPLFVPRVDRLRVCMNSHLSIDPYIQESYVWEKRLPVKKKNIEMS